MNREDVEKIFLNKSENQPLRVQVKGLPKHLLAEISVGQGRCQFILKRDGDVRPYEQNPPSPTPEAALQELKNLLNWDPKIKT